MFPQKEGSVWACQRVEILNLSGFYTVLLSSLDVRDCGFSQPSENYQGVFSTYQQFLVENNHQRDILLNLWFHIFPSLCWSYSGNLFLKERLGGWDYLSLPLWTHCMQLLVPCPKTDAHVPQLVQLPLAIGAHHMWVCWAESLNIKDTSFLARLMELFLSGTLFYSLLGQVQTIDLWMEVDDLPREGSG